MVRELQTQRLISALVAHDADPRRLPLRRAGTVTLTGVLLAALATGLLAGYGMLTGAGLASPTDPSAILLDRGTGARYVYLESDARLHPILNYTSGLLLVGPSVKAVAPGKLAKVPLGTTLGIADAPESLPAGLLADAWTVCTDRAGHGTLLVGTVPAGAPLTGRALLVRDPAGRTFLVRDGRRFQLPAGGAGRTPSPVAAAWIDAVPAGPDLTAVPSTAETADFAVRACVTRPMNEPATIRLDVAVPEGTTPTGQTRIDAVHVPRGKGAVVTATTGAVHLVTDDGRGFPLASAELLPRLGYPDVKPVTVPAEVLALLPAGPLLDPEVAGRH
ncbi:type VII secretion protein EccB [Actinoplanes sp. NPDC020271]|uniref:type VII secretion protein EccB n=1 Tax=Actinoplanes sp. NPDC020271 TaxID=3363896 RepID=UPI0037A9D1C4